MNKNKISIMNRAFQIRIIYNDLESDRYFALPSEKWYRLFQLDPFSLNWLKKFNDADNHILVHYRVMQKSPIRPISVVFLKMISTIWSPRGRLRAVLPPNLLFFHDVLLTKSRVSLFNIPGLCCVDGDCKSG
jgi:hypothetical protein